MLANVLLILFLQVFPPVPPLPSPTYIPTLTPVPTADSAIINTLPLYNFLATASANINALPDNPSEPGGVSAVPDTNANTIFGYVRWLFSGNSAQELLGPTLAGMAIPFVIIMTNVITLTGFYMLVNFITSLAKGVVWLVQQILKFVPFLGAFALQIPPTPTPMPPAPTAQINMPGGYTVWYFADDAVAWWNRIGQDKTQVLQIVAILLIVFGFTVIFIAYIRSLAPKDGGGE